MKGDQLDEICLRDSEVNKSKIVILIIMKIDTQKKKNKLKTYYSFFQCVGKW